MRRPSRPGALACLVVALGACQSAPRIADAPGPDTVAHAAQRGAPPQRVPTDAREGNRPAVDASPAAKAAPGIEPVTRRADPPEPAIAPAPAAAGDAAGRPDTPAPRPPATASPDLVVEANDLVDPRSPAAGWLQDARTALADFPRDRLGRVDWGAALADGSIAPRAAVDGPGRQRTRDDVVVMRNTRSMPWVHFPHRPHTEWLDCSSCHPRPFARTAGASAYTMDDMYRGEGCGLCHDRVAFSTFACERCHVEPHDGSPGAWW